MIESQEKTITNLLKAVRDQHDQLDHQKIKIKNLEEKVVLQDFICYLCKTHLRFGSFVWKLCLGNTERYMLFFRADNIIYQHKSICILLQLSYDSFQDTVNKAIDSDPEPPDMFEYLTGNSTGLNMKGKTTKVIIYCQFCRVHQYFINTSE